MKRIIFVLLVMLCTFNIKAQNLRIVEGSVQDYRGNTIANATINIFGNDKFFKCDENGSFSIEIPIQTFALVASSEGYQSKYLEVDGTYMLFILRPKTQRKIALEEQQIQFAKQKEIEAKNKAKEEYQLILQKEAEAKAKAEEQARIAAQKEAEAEAKAKAKAEKQAKRDAEKVAEEARIAAQKAAEAKAKAEKQAKRDAEKAAKEQYVNWLEEQRAKQAEILEQRAKQAEILEQRRAAEDYE